MGFLQDTIAKFQSDKRWNTENSDGSHRFDKEIAWIEQMVNEYAVALKMEPDRVAEMMEKERDYSWPNYYQPANFPGLDAKSLIGVFDTFETFRTYAKEHWEGFKCSRCGDTTPHPQLCIHRLNQDKKCDWCADGLFKGPRSVIVLESGLSAIPTFEPIPKKEEQK